MKRIVLLLIAVAVIIVLCAIGFMLFTQKSDTVKAQLIIDSGSVQVRQDEGLWTSAQNGMFLYESDSVKTGSNTSASVILFKSSIIRLDSNTEVTIQKLLREAGETTIEMQQEIGRTWNTILNISGIDNYDVYTPTTVASIRGTTFVVTVFGDNDTYIGVDHKTVFVSAIQDGQVVNSVELNTEEAVTVDLDTINQSLEIIPFEPDDWMLENKQKDMENIEKVKEELYERIDEYIPELKETYGVTDEELDVLIEGYLLGYYGLPPETPEWIREIIELS
jgi:hypothetical protein